MELIVIIGIVIVLIMQTITQFTQNKILNELSRLDIDLRNTTEILGDNTEGNTEKLRDVMLLTQEHIHGIGIVTKDIKGISILTKNLVESIISGIETITPTESIPKPSTKKPTKFK